MGCQAFTSTPQTDARVRLYSEVSGDTLSLSLTLEGLDGQSLSGANVSLIDPAGAWQSIPFNMTKNAYTLSLPALSGTYSAEVDSVAVGRKTVSFPVTLLSPKPQLLLIRDGAGRDAKSFAALQVSTPINLQWMESKGAKRYLVEARQAGVTVYSETTTDSSLTLPANLFTASDSGGSVTVEVMAEHQLGDRQFRTSEHFSASSLAGGSYTFQVVP